jgi:hypothetical protein
MMSEHREEQQSDDCQGTSRQRYSRLEVVRTEEGAHESTQIDQTCIATISKFKLKQVENRKKPLPCNGGTKKSLEFVKQSKQTKNTNQERGHKEACTQLALN